MPSPVAISAESELALSPAYKRSQRALSRWLERDHAAPHTMFRARGALKALNAKERSQLAQWLGWLGYAARCNRKPVLLARVERLCASLDQHAPSARPRRATTTPLVTPAHGLLRSA